MAPVNRARVVAAAQAVLDQGGWCVLELCLDIPGQQWEPAVLIFDLVAEPVANTVAAEIAAQPSYDARLTGCHRGTLAPDPAMGTHLLYLADPSIELHLSGT